MKNNKKGLSTIVATLLIILLTLVAVGIIWIVIRNVVQQGTDQIDIDSKCLAASVEATKVTNDTTDYYVTITRNGGDEPLGGVKLVFTTAEGDGNAVIDWSLTGTGDNAPLNALGARELQITRGTGSDEIPDTLGYPNKVSVVVYFLDSSGNPQLCSTANQYTFR